MEFTIAYSVNNASQFYRPLTGSGKQELTFHGLKGGLEPLLDTFYVRILFNEVLNRSAKYT